MARSASPGRRAEAFEAVLGDLSGDVFLTTSTIDDFASLVDVLDVDGEVPADVTRVNVLTDGHTASQVRRTFVLASRVVDRVEAEVLDVRSAEPRTPFATLLVGDLAVRSVAGISGETVTTLTADADESAVEESRDAFRERWETAEPFAPRAPPYARMLDSAASTLGADPREDLEALFRLTAADGPVESEMDPVQLSLLVGARNEAQFYELGLWGESEGVASRAKFSREKQTLEEADLVRTEKIPTDVGRPRQRLLLGPAVDADDLDALYEEARDVLGR